METEQYEEQDTLTRAEYALEAERAPGYFEDERGFERENERDQEATQTSDEQAPYEQSGYHFDRVRGEVIGPDGESWTAEVLGNADTQEAAIHREMLHQWRSGGDPEFRLPDHEEGGTLYVTHMMLHEDGSVGYRIEEFARTHRAPETPAFESDAAPSHGDSRGAEWLPPLDESVETSKEQERAELSQEALAQFLDESKDTLTAPEREHDESMGNEEHETNAEKEVVRLFEHVEHGKHAHSSPPPLPPARDTRSARTLHGISMRRMAA